MSYRCIEVRQSIWKCVRQTKHSKCIRIYLRIFICIKNSRDTVKQKREWVSEWKKRKKGAIFIHTTKISLTFGQMFVSSSSALSWVQRVRTKFQDEICIHRRFHSYTHYNGMCVCVHSAQNEAVSVLQLLQMCFVFFSSSFFVRHCQMSRERKRDGWEIQLFLLALYREFGCVTSPSTSFSIHTFIFFHAVGDVTQNVWFSSFFLWFNCALNFSYVRNIWFFHPSDIRFQHIQIKY